MAYLPYATRHLQKTIEDHIEARLQTLGWLGPAGSVPFGAAVVLDGRGQPGIQRGAMDESALKAVSGNMVGVSFGSEPDDQPQEMGGGLMAVEHTVFVDCLGEKDAIAVALASDIKDLFAGRAPGTSRYVQLYSYAADPRTPVLDWRLELTDIYRQEGTPSVRRNWQIVKATVEAVFTSEDDGS